MYAGRSKVAGDENSVSGGTESSQEAWSLQVNRHEITERFLSETLDNVLVVLHHVGGDCAVESVGSLDSEVDRVLHQRPGGERGAGHEDCSVKESCGSRQC